jgi:beta-glucanase (GH16 family)
VGNQFLVRRDGRPRRWPVVRTVSGLLAVTLLVLGLTQTSGAAKPIHFRPPTTAQPVAVSSDPPYAGMSLVFNGSFAGRDLNSSQWQTCYPWGDSGSGCTNFGNSQEIEWYLPSQVQVSNGALHLIAQETPTLGTDQTGAAETYPYRSGIVTTYGSFSFTYGYVQVVARIPGGTGTWPTLWLLPTAKTATGWQWPPEIDIMQDFGSDNTISCNLLWGSAANVQDTYQWVTSQTDLTNGWHTYGLAWEPGSLTWYLDGQVVDSLTGNEIPDQPMYFLANLAIDGLGSSTSSFDIQSVQIYQNAN